MNKKLIKYLIWTIIITAMLILMPGKETRAVTKTVKYSEFQTSKNLFCLNHGWRFSSKETFEVEDIKIITNKNGEKTIKFPGAAADVKEDVLNYIVTETLSSTYNSKTSISDYVPQIAIWKLVNPNDNKANSSDANKLIANANAYKNFINVGAPVPEIEKDGNNVIIKYYRATAKVNGFPGEYTNLLVDSITVTGAKYKETKDIGNNYYEEIYTADSGIEEVTIRFDYERERSAEFELYTNTNTEEKHEEEIGGGPYTIEYIKSDGIYQCNQCIKEGNGIGECFKIDKSEFYNRFPYTFMLLKFERNEKFSDTFETMYNDANSYKFFACSNKLHGVLVYYNHGGGYKWLSAEWNDPLNPYVGGGTWRIFDMYIYKDRTQKVTKQNLLHVKKSTISTNTKSEKVSFETPMDLTINKVDALTNSKLSGATFNIAFTNVKSIDGNNGNTSLISKTTDANGQINLTGIKATDNTKPITVIITETAVPSANGYYYNVDSTQLILTFTYSNGSWTGTGVSDNKASVRISNQPYIKLSGNVWEDGQTGEKNVSGPNGVKDTGEKNLQGVIVELLDSNGNKLKSTTTDANGNYSFTDIPKTNEGYKIRFKYNGITYKETPYGTVSIPTEDNRTGFNNKFKTISQGQSNDGTTLSYTYSNGASTLNADIAGNTTGTNDAKFQTSATTGTYTETTETISCGLVKKNFDLAIGTDVKEAKLTINDKTTTYNYAQIMNGELNADFQNNSASTNNVIYNLYLYKSDYNYRIKDYKTDSTEENIANTVNPSDNTVNNYENLKELEAYVTYSVILKSQTTNSVTETSTVEEFVYYYDSAFEPYNIVSTNKYSVSIDTNARKITFTSKNGGFNLTASNDYRATVDLTFKINKDSNGNITTKTATNVAEITRYSTSEGGLIDKDSAPANGITNGKITQYEDDTDEAKGLNIVLRTDGARTITGTVFEDKDKNGNNNDNTPVNDVIVQLIEIKRIGGQYYEYIWQETRSGSNKVKTTARNGYSGTTYENSVTAGSGKFEFKDFIPGNYIIRYIYGDGSTYNITTDEYKASADNVRKYNGQDYKSTVDSHYTAAWYNTAGYNTGESVARDNEARRLEVMAYSAKIDASIGMALENTWMCAETSKINIPVDADDTTTDADITTASYNYTKADNKVSFENMNFGLALRPQTNLSLEKHITSLKITPSGTGVQSIVDAKAESIEKIVNGTTVEVEGITDGLAIIKSTRDNRGFWELATDVEELAQGAEVEVEYTYVVKNDGEEDFLSSFLINAYENENESYSTLLNQKSSEVKTATKGQTHKYTNYLGEFYYTGVKGTNDAVVPSRIELIEEALNNELVFDDTEGTYFAIERESSTEKVYGVDKSNGTREVTINTVVRNTSASKFLTPKTTGVYTENSADWTKTIKLRTTLSSVSGGELGANLPSYIAQIVQYSNAAGRKDMKATPGNLSYVHSDDNEMTMENSNERDEFWAEKIIVTKPTGEDKVTPLQIVVITISGIAVLAVGIILIKKYALKK